MSDINVPHGRLEPKQHHPDSIRFHEILAEAGELHDKKQRDYGTPDSPFANLEASEQFGVPAWLGILVRMNDKMSRLKTFARTRKLANEGVIDTCMDMIVYANALRIAFEKFVHDPAGAAKQGLKW